MILGLAKDLPYQFTITGNGLSRDSDPQPLIPGSPSPPRIPLILVSESPLSRKGPPGWHFASSELSTAGCIPTCVPRPWGPGRSMSIYMSGSPGLASESESLYLQSFVLQNCLKKSLLFVMCIKKMSKKGTDTLVSPDPKNLISFFF